ncbi:MAG: FGGY family carbohydrate kinase [Candidatus Hydrogenedentota bacterium]
MPDLTLALDIGTTSLRAVIFDPQWVIAGQSHDIIASNAPHPGWLEQDPEEIWTKTMTAAREAIRAATATGSDVTSIGITTQRASCMVWERTTGNPLTPLVSWQDMRGIQRAHELGEQGFPLMPASSACKLESILDAIPNGRQRMNADELCWGNIDSYIVFRLTGGAVHATDHSQACATGYYDMQSNGWNDALLKIQDLSPDFFPELVDTSGVIGETIAKHFNATIPIGAIVGDQQSSAVAQGCTEPGDLKFTFGTSGTCNVNTGQDILSLHGTYPLVLRHENDTTTYCIEAMIMTAGAMLDWTANLLNRDGLFTDSDHPVDSSGVYVLPALQGLGSPHANPNQTASIVGLTRSTTPQHIADATLEGICYRAREIVEAITEHSPHPVPERIAIDGGLSSNTRFTQLLATIIAKPLAISPHQEATALGAAVLARHLSDSQMSYTKGSEVPPDSTRIKHYSDAYEQWKSFFHLH